VYLYTDDVPAISPVRCLDLLELGNRLCLPRLVNLVERRVVEEMVRLCGSDGADVVVEHCLRLLEPCKVATLQSWIVDSS
jgi:Rho-related BTB domain-containing protein 1/2